MSCRIYMLSLLFFVAQIGFASTLFADQSDQGIVVWRLEAKTGVSDNDIDSISGIITSDVERYSGMKVVSEADIKTILKGEETRQQCGVDDTSCLTEIGAALGVPEAVSGDLGRVGNIWVLNLRRINVRSAEVISRATSQVEGEIDDLVMAVGGTVADLFDVAEADQPVHPMNPYKKAAYGTFFSGLSLGILGGVFLGMSAMAADDYRNRTSPSDADDASKIYGPVGIGGLSIGGALMVAGIVLWVLDPGDKAWAKDHVISAGPTPEGDGAMLQFAGRW